MDFAETLNKRPRTAALSSGVLLALAFPPFNVSWLAWFALIPLLVVTATAERLRAFLLGLTAGTAFFLITMPWIYNVIAHFGHVWPPLAVVFVLFLGLYMGSYFGLFSWAMVSGGGGKEAVLAAPLFFVLAEWLRGWMFTGFPWVLLAHSQWLNPEVIQLASLTGAWGVTFLIALVNAALAYWMLYGFSPKKAALPAAVLLLAVGNYGWGGWKIDQMKKAPATPLGVSVVQGNIPQDRKWNDAFRRSTVNVYETLTLKEAEQNRPDLIVWPETAVPFFYDRNVFYTFKLNELSASLPSAILFGGLAAEARQDGQLDYYNRAWVIRRGERLGHYDKMHLVPFGEYVPLRPLLFFADKISDALPSDTAAGTRTEPIPVDGVAAGVQVCFEVMFAGPTRMFVQNGATMIVNITNDAWFGKTGASAQHMAALPFRAVENGVPVVRSANTGVSGFVSAWGQVSDRTGLFVPATAYKEIRVPMHAGTLYTRFGDIFVFICALGAVAALVRQRSL